MDPSVVSTNQAQLVELLRDASSTDPAIRNPADAFLLRMHNETPLAFFNSLISIFCDIQEPSVVQNALYLAKKVFVVEHAFSSIARTIADEMLTGVQRNLLNRLGDIQLSAATRASLKELIVALVVRVTHQRQARRHLHLFGAANNNANLSSCWPGLFSQLYDVANSNSLPIGLRTTSLDIYCESAPTLLGCTDCGRELSKFIELICTWLGEAKTEPQLAVAAARAASLIVVAINDPMNHQQRERHELDRIAFGIIQAYEDRCAALLSSSSSSSSSSSADATAVDVAEFVKVFDSITVEDPSFFLPAAVARNPTLRGNNNNNNNNLPIRLFESILTATEKFAQQKPESSLYDVVRVEAHLALLSAICARFNELNKPLVKTFIQRAFDLALSIMHVGLGDGFFDLDAWKVVSMPIEDEITCDRKELDVIPLFTAASRTVASLVDHELLTFKQIVELLLPHIEGAAAKGWKEFAIAHDLVNIWSVHPAKKSVLNRMTDFMNKLIVPGLQHEHPFVRFCAARCVGVLIANFTPKFQEQFAATPLIPILSSPFCIYNGGDDDDDDDSDDKEKHTKSNLFAPCVEQVSVFALGSIFDELHSFFPDDDDDDDADCSDFNAARKKSSKVTADGASSSSQSKGAKDKSRNAMTAYLDPFFEPTVNVILAALSKHEDAARKPPFVINRHVRALNAIAQLGGSRVTNLVTDMIPCLKILVGKYYNLYEQNCDALLSSSNMQNASATQVQELQCLLGAIETAGLCFSVLPSDPQNRPELHQSAIEFTMFLIEFLESKKFKSYSGTVKYLLRALTCMTEHLCQDISPLLPRFIPTLLNYANLECDYKVVNPASIPPGVAFVFDEEKGKIEFIRSADPTGGGMEEVVSLPVQMLEVKDIAATILSTLCDSVKGVLYEYVEKIGECAINLLDVKASADIRESGAYILANLIKVIEDAEQRPSSSSSTEAELGTLVTITKQEKDRKLGDLAQNALFNLFEAMSAEETEANIPKYLESIRKIIPHRNKIARSNTAGQAAGYVYEQLDHVRDSFIRRAIDEFEDYAPQILGLSGLDEEEIEQLEAELSATNDEVQLTLGEVDLCCDAWAKLCPREACEIYASKCSFAMDMLETIESYKKFYEYEAFLEKKKQNNNSNNKKSQKKTATSSNNNNNNEQEEENEPIPCCNPSRISSVGANEATRLGLFVQHFPVDSGDFLRTIQQSWTLFDLIPLINHAHVLRCAGWTLAVCFIKWKEYFESRKKRDEASQDNAVAALSEDGLKMDTVAKAHRALFVLHRACLSAKRVDLNDVTNEDALPAIANLASCFASVLNFLGEHGLVTQVETTTLNSLQIASDLATFFIEWFPLAGDEEEASLYVYPKIAEILIDQPQHPLFGAEAKNPALRQLLLQKFEKMIANDSFFNLELEEKLLKSGLFPEQEAKMRTHLEKFKDSETLSQ